MRKFIKYFSALSLILTVFACSNNSKDDLKYGAQEEIGWIQFPESNPAVIEVNTEAQPFFDVGIDVQVPVVNEDFVIGYTLVPVTGLDPNTVFSNSGQVVSLAGETSYAGPDNNTSSEYVYLTNITFNTASIPALSEVMEFDIVLTSSSNGNITVGLAGTDKPITQRVRILCSNPDELPADYFVGNYMIQDVTATIGPGNGTSNFAPGMVSITVDPFNPNVRRFDVAVLPAFTGGALQPVSLTFGSNDRIVMGNVSSGIGCGGGIEYIYGQRTGNNSFWDVCNDQSVIIRYTEDVNSSCGGPYNASFSLTKL